MAQLIWSVGAIDEVEEIVRYIERDSPETAVKVAEAVDTSAKAAANNPYGGPMVEEFLRENLRERLASGYRVIYRVRPGSVTIVRVWRASRPLPRKLP
jgi:plasmid stabilization system protein ParE